MRIVLIMLLLTSCAHLDTVDKTMMVTAAGLTAADYYQTQDMIDEPNLMEFNPVIGQDKEKAKVVIISGGALVVTAAYFLPDKWRKVLLAYYIGERVAYVTHNERVRREM